MKLVNEDRRSFIDDIKEIGLLKFLTWAGDDVAPSWRGPYEPATRSNDAELASLADFNRDHYLFYRALIERYVEKSGSILDIGCGTGQRTAMLSRYSARTVGIDSDPMKIHIAPHLNGDGKIKWVFGDFMEHNFSEKFDHVFAVEVIEHIPIDAHGLFIDRAIDSLSAGGALLLTTPRDDNPDRRYPHVGLWDDDTAASLAETYKGEIGYFSHRALDNGDLPWSDKRDSTHYVFVVRK